MNRIKFNVAQLLREEIGARRDYEFSEDALPLDETLVLRTISGWVRFTRTTTGVFAHVQASGTVQLVCVRSLDEFDYPVEIEAEDQFHSVVDVFTGAKLHKPAEEDPFFLDEFHMADIGRMIREYTLLELPINPVAPAYRDQPVSYSVEDADDDENEDSAIDERLQVLKQWTARQQN